MSSPSDEELQDALVQLKAAHPGLGIPKLHARLRADFPAWTVSEKRMRKILTALSPKAIVSPSPSSQLVDGLDITQWTTRVDVRMFDKKKGKGLVATQKIKAGETIWVEDPFIIAPEWEIYDKQRAGAACSLCTTLFASPLEAKARCPLCPAVFCNALCRKRSEKTHPLLCAAQNPASMPLLRWVRSREWMALLALIQCTARLLLANAAGEEALAADWAVVRGFAVLGMEERARYSFRSEPDRETWKAAFELFCATFHRPRREDGAMKNQTAEEKKVAAILRKPLPAEIEAALFDYNTGFLHGLGRMNLNLESHGGLYTLHAHLNHGCTPNASVRHLDQRRALARITVRALADIEPGQELFITYVNPELGYADRRAGLEAWGFVCQCARCMEEGRDWKPPEHQDGLGDLASELKAGLGVI
ncbi:Set-like protein [Mycena sanguinolenta]|uniref:Histone-lysine N-methyltransferase SET5 n=1 Tax=Mycena sanguinolenta TaxID=230812 RepID=A0A8H6Z9U2_9AGAR|nr:Set-like protein [Mycena sanguinolenta]